jgi:hypothetical protein
MEALCGKLYATSDERRRNSDRRIRRSAPARRQKRSATARVSSAKDWGVDLYWLPLGAGGHSVRLNGIVYEALVARIERRHRCDLYHSALEVRGPSGRFVIEMTPVRPGEGSEHDAVAVGAVGTRWAGAFRIFRYEVRRWRDGRIPDVAEAVDSPQQLSADPETVQRVIDLVPQVPTPVWEMWNSNSLIAWLLTRSRIDGDSIRPPTGGRAPGWQAGLVVAQRQLQRQGPMGCHASPDHGATESSHDPQAKASAMASAVAND